MPAPEQVTLQRLVDAADGELWAFLDSEVRAARLTPVEARDLLHEVLPGWGGQYEDAAAAVAADLYDQKRLANDLDLIIPYRVELPEPATAARWGILASWAIPAVDEEFRGMRRSRRSSVARIERLRMRTGTRLCTTRSRTLRRGGGSGSVAATRRATFATC